MIVPDKVKNLFEKQALVAFATADKDGKPNAVPMFWKTFLNDETILIIDNFMKMTKQNLQENDKVCISFWDAATEEAYKIKGTAKYYSEGEIYEEGKKFIQSKKPDRIPRGVVEVKVTEIFNISPGSTAGKRLE